MIDCPGFFLHGNRDKIINSSHSDRIVKNYKGIRKYYKFNGDHNDIRLIKVYDDVIEFFIKYFQTDLIIKPIEEYKELKEFNRSEKKRLSEYICEENPKDY